MINKFATVIACFSLLFFSSCSIKSSDSGGSPYAAVSVYALSPDAPYVNLFLNQYTIAANVPFGSYTLYNQVAAGTCTVSAQSINQNTPVVNTNFTTSEGKYYSVFLVDSFNKVKTVAVNDDLQTITGDSVRIRFFNFSPDAPAVDLCYADSTGKKILWRNRPFTTDLSNDTINRFVYLKAGSYTFSALTNSGVDTLSTFAATALAKGNNYTLFLKGFTKNATGSDTTISLGIRLH